MDSFLLVLNTAGIGLGIILLGSILGEIADHYAYMACTTRGWNDEDN